MNTLFKMYFATALILTISACNNKQEGKNNPNENEVVKIVTTDTTQNTMPASGKISLDKLPANINEFVTTNYAGYTIENAAHDPLCSGGDAIDVAISKKGSSNYSLIFLPNGTFVQQEEDIDIRKAPSKVLEIVKMKYAGFTPAQQIERLTLADKSIQYLFDITKDKTAREVIFNEEGTVICESKE